MNLKHIAIFGNKLSVKGKFIQDLLAGSSFDELEDFQGKKGLLFSEVVLTKYLEEDYRHGKSAINKKGNRPLSTFSSGERRKALLEYQLKQTPDFLILDNPFDSLDKASVAQLRERLKEISEEIPIIQIFKREADLLPFVTMIFEIQKEKIVGKYSGNNFKKVASENTYTNLAKIPKPALAFKEIPDILVDFKEVSLSYEGKPILKDISWQIKKGDFWQLSGPNGSGKSTLLSMIFGDNPKAYGEDLYLFGNKKGSGESVWELKRKIGYFSLALTELFNRRDTVLEMLISGMVDSVGLYRRPGDKQKRIARGWLKVLALEQKEKAIFTKLSALEQRLVLIARAMIKHPPLLILDEPTTALDDKSAKYIVQLINHIAKESNTAIIYVSHRREPGLEPKAVYRLVPSEKGSIGEIV
ncbi:molybdate transport system ATP-binding protein [Salegentibacter echinorum]|uniref:Molybdate transport system ATP-binding protein n=1 Tax=Salegentibacter echinorum TaxID=1073325 RepID=A0A1M5KS50_SALEC|nr:ATP-binding cassette domain-containing protein [Salegentibacter echinorum]SHG55624.1 molybdate transport system ATP-binding protein [Salegentibacter echinorum]